MIRGQAFTAFMTFFVTLALYPALTVEMKSQYAALGNGWYGIEVFKPV